MTATLAPNTPTPYCSNPNGLSWIDNFLPSGNTSFSPTAKKLNSINNNISFRGSYSSTSISALDNLEDQLSAISFECSTADWDGYGALAINSNADSIIKRVSVRNITPGAFTKD